jgi:hypothetical protein
VLCTPGLLSRLAGRFVIVWVGAATNLTPALLFSPGGDGRILGPAFLSLSGGDATARSQAAALALAAVLANLTAVAVAYGAGVEPDEKDL